MKGRRHWTVYVVLLIALVTFCLVTTGVWLRVKWSLFEDVVMQAGGTIHYKEITHRGIMLNTGSVSVEITSGSHPVNEVLKRINSHSSITELALGTSDVGDHLLPLLKDLEHIEVLDLRKSEITNQGALEILDALPGLKELQLSSEFHNRDDLAGAAPHRLTIEK